MFLEQEKEKFIAWWQDISMRELAIYLAGAFCLLLIVSVYYDILGITELFQWYRFGRNMGVFPSDFPDGAHDREESSPSFLAHRVYSFLFMDFHFPLCAHPCGERHEGSFL